MAHSLCAHVALPVGMHSLTPAWSVTVVERVDSCASLYSCSIQGHHVCLLVKKGEKSVSVDGKCSDSTLLGNLLEEVKATLAKC